MKPLLKSIAWPLVALAFAAALLFCAPKIVDSVTRSAQQPTARKDEVVEERGIAVIGSVNDGKNAAPSAPSDWRVGPTTQAASIHDADLQSSDGIDLAPEIAQYVDTRQGTLDEAKLFALSPMERIGILSRISDGVHSEKSVAAYSIAKRAQWGNLQAIAEFDPSILIDRKMGKVEPIDGIYAELLDLYPVDRKDELTKELIAIIQLLGAGNDDALRGMIRKRLMRTRGPATEEIIDATLSRYKQRVKLIPDAAAFIVELRHRLKPTTDSQEASVVISARDTLDQGKDGKK